MKKQILTAACLLTSLLVSFGGSPIILTETEACAQADLVVVATIGEFSDIPGDGTNVFDPDASKWHQNGFKKFGSAEVKETLLGEPPSKLIIYGGQVGVNMFYRLREPGTYLLLLKQVEGNAYHPADSVYSFMPVVDGKVGWLVDVSESKRIWITSAEALIRIKDNKTQANKAETSAEDKVPVDAVEAVRTTIDIDGVPLELSEAAKKTLEILRTEKFEKITINRVEPEKTFEVLKASLAKRGVTMRLLHYGKPQEYEPADPAPLKNIPADKVMWYFDQMVQWGWIIYPDGSITYFDNQCACCWPKNFGCHQSQYDAGKPEEMAKAPKAATEKPKAGQDAAPSNGEKPPN